MNNVVNLKERIEELEKERDYYKTKYNKANNSYSLSYREIKEEVEETLKDKTPYLVEDKGRTICNTKGVTHSIIEGDNLSALWLLDNNNTKIDVIYIDPPYNTGNDFTFKDDFIDEGDKHSAWLSFMNKRLRLARKVLSEDGIIFISIDDNEQAQLKILLDNIFGEENFIETFIWNHNKSGSLISKYTRKTGEYIHCYAKDKSKLDYRFKHKIENNNTKAALFNSNNSYSELLFRKGSIRFKNKKDRIIERFKEKDLELKTDIIVKDGVNSNDVIISSHWKWGQEYLENELSKGNFLLANNDRLRLNYVKLNNKRITPPTKILTEVGYSRTGSAEVEGYNVDFDYPKPVKLIKYLVDMVTYNRPNATILDFFAGSGTTLEAVVRLNKEDGGNRRCILVNTNEISDTDTAKYLNKKHGTDFKLTKTGSLSKQKKNIESFNNFIEGEEFKEIKEEEEYRDIGICRRVTYERSRRLIEGYINNKGKEVEGFNNNNLKYYYIAYKDTCGIYKELKEEWVA